MRTILNLVTVCGLLLAAGSLSACGEDSEGERSGVAITATTTQVADLARQVGGGRADVAQILAPNADPHEYEPQPSDAESLIEADLVLRSGGDVDLWLDQIVEGSGSDSPVVSLIDSVPASTGADAEVDPHWWQNPENAIAAVKRIRDELSAIDPAGARTYGANAGAYVVKLRELDRAIADCIDSVPLGERELVTSHDALGAYAERYGIDVVGAAIPALSTQAQASAGETAELVEIIERTGVTTIFPEAGVSRDLEETIAAQAGASVGDELWADALGPEGSDGATYLEAMAANTTKLVEGFTAGAQTCRGLPG